jgi:hypothetical protein
MARYATIHVPPELRSRIKALAEREGVAQWEVISRALSFYETQLRNPRVKQELSNLEKVSWYITKLATSFGAFKENPSPENMAQLRERIEELQQRLGVDASLLLKFAEYYHLAKDEEVKRKLRQDMNAAFKTVIKDMLLTTIFELEAVAKR